jgi:excinuclease ABC subunit A
LQDVGLGYVQWDNPLLRFPVVKHKNKTSLFLGKRRQRKSIICDRPTTGLHFHDIKKLLASFNALIDKGHSILVIEHNLDLIKCADWIIDLGPEGGENGGQLLETPEQIMKIKKSITGHYLKDKL